MAALVIPQGLFDFFPGVHYKRAVLHDRLADRFAGYQQHTGRLCAALQHQLVTVIQHTGCRCLQPGALAPRDQLGIAFVQVQHGVVAGRYRQ